MTTRFPPLSPQNRDVYLSVLFFLLALGVFAAAQLGVDESEILHDSAHYMELGRSIARGEGYTTQTRWALNIPSSGDGASFPDTYRAPAFPYLLAGIYKVTGNLFDSARWLISFFGAFIPPLVFLIVRRRLGLPLGAAIVAGILAAFHHHLVIAGTRPLTETPYTLGVLATFYLVSGGRPGWAGLAAGCTWLFRTQGLLLVPVGLLLFWWQGRKNRTVLRHGLLFVGIFVLVISPWLVRTYEVTGNPFYSDLKYHVLSSHDPNIVPFDYDITTFEYFHGLTPAPEPIMYMLNHIPETFEHTVRGLRRLGRMSLRENAGNLLLAFFAGIGLLVILRRRPLFPTEPTTRQLLVAVGLFAAMNIGLVAVSFVDHRHLTALDPFYVIGSAVGLWAMYVTLAKRHRLVGIAAFALIFGCGLAWEMKVGYRSLAAHTPYSWLEADLTAAAIDPDTPGTIMAKKPYYFSYRLDRPAMSLPWCSDEDFVKLIREHDVRYIAIGDQVRNQHAYPGSFMDRGIDPPWLKPVVRHVTTTPVIVYEVVPELLPKVAEPEAAAETGGATVQSASPSTDAVPARAAALLSN